MDNKRQGRLEYTGREVWINQKTGEVREVDEFERPIGRTEPFVVAYLAEIINMIETLGTKKMLVVKFILTKMNKATNTLIATVPEIAKGANVSEKTVREALKQLEDAGIISRRYGSLMLSPRFCNNWKPGKEAYMMIKYSEFAGDEERRPHIVNDERKQA